MFVLRAHYKSIIFFNEILYVEYSYMMSDEKKRISYCSTPFELITTT